MPEPSEEAMGLADRICRRARWGIGGKHWRLTAELIEAALSAARADRDREWREAMVPGITASYEVTPEVVKEAWRAEVEAARADERAKVRVAVLGATDLLSKNGHAEGPAYWTLVELAVALTPDQPAIRSRGEGGA